MANLLDLPTELLLQIINDPQLAICDLYAFGIVCRRLNAITIPLYLASYSIHSLDNIELVFKGQYPQLTVSVSDQIQPSWIISRNRLDPLTGLQVAFYADSIRDLHCAFQQSFTSTENIVPHLSRISDLIRRLVSLETVVLDFERDHKERDVRGDPACSVTRSFAAAFGVVLAQLSVKGCEHLCLYNRSRKLEDWEHDFDKVLHVEEPSSTHCVFDQSRNLVDQRKARGLTSMVRRAKARLGSAFKCSHLKGGNVEDEPPEPPPKDYSSTGPTYMRMSSSLRSLFIQTPFAFLDPCFPSTRRLIYASANTLTSLTLSHITLEPALFSRCLSSLIPKDMNSITQLSLSYCQTIPPKTLIDLLTRLQSNLEVLELDRALAYLPPGEDFENLHFPFLHTLKIPNDWARPLFEQHIGYLDDHGDFVFPAPLPKLNSLLLYLRTSTTHYFSYPAFSSILPPLFDFLQPRYLSSLYSSESRMDIALDIRLDPKGPWQLERDRAVFNMLSGEPKWQASAASSTLPPLRSFASQYDIHSSLQTVPRAPKHWDIITRLSLSPMSLPSDKFEANTLTRWVVTFFPAVEEVSLAKPFVPYISGKIPLSRSATMEADLIEKGVQLLNAALNEMQDNVNMSMFAWRKLVVGQSEFDLDVDDLLQSSTFHRTEQGGLRVVSCS